MGKNLGSLSVVDDTISLQLNLLISELITKVSIIQKMLDFLIIQAAQPPQ